MNNHTHLAIFLATIIFIKGGSFALSRTRFKKNNQLGKN
ncbi:hypothetical protein BTHERMOSOX_979 [Bathymodiolus thermophilus thioautotrophic gill symbiont]|uniref:Uncharacterized protein n=1 Tax=Bathymodiolus thermophilus thioautotrophic gill symbiont TaxID=2360 RepID=A0A8H8XA55_9GAMM|nr:hypothetical protein THERMOS_379 [Bathymodiolus thermophilus thioautotrophic gill symbiont]CAB5499496.1 hypothetical protein THERMOT_1056 [Bathymodiolus thermophilus thioautotrophic gill symbiont]SHA27924.1 hypothetical protein BTHERMOSOX_979 [Bathymodiolus thermophilus thioautotrophic gill symbiont]